MRGLVGPAAKGVIGGIQRTAKGIRDGGRKCSQSVAGRPGEAGVKDVNGGIQVAAKGSGTAGVRAVTPASRLRRGSADAEEHRQGLHSALFGSD